MRKLLLYCPLFLLSFCAKDKGLTPVAPAILPACDYNQNAVISFSLTVSPLLHTKCGSCHSNPGAGGINTDNYLNIKNLAQTGDLIPLVSNTNPNSIMMPPDPVPHLDSCQIMALDLWIKAGCPDN